MPGTLLDFWRHRGNEVDMDLGLDLAKHQGDRDLTNCPNNELITVGGRLVESKKRVRPESECELRP